MEKGSIRIIFNGHWVIGKFVEANVATNCIELEDVCQIDFGIDKSGGIGFNFSPYGFPLITGEEQFIFNVNSIILDKSGNPALEDAYTKFMEQLKNPAPSNLVLPEDKKIII